MPPKRACDICISRKVKCNGSWPCDTCHGAVKKVQCTYLRPARRRGPKSRRTCREDADQPTLRVSDEHRDQASESIAKAERTISLSQPTEASSTQRIPTAVLESIVRLYQRYSYSIWPVINAEVLLSKIKDIEADQDDHHAQNIVCLATALCAATMAQLHVEPQVTEFGTVDSTALVQACLRRRNKFHDHGEHIDLRSIMVSFFLHVHHAKANQRNSAMMYIQEAIAGARVLRLDEVGSQKQDEVFSNTALVFPLLWVSERGYALHLGLSPSYNEPLSITDPEMDNDADVEAQGLLELAKLFVAFDRIAVRRKSPTGATTVDLTDTENKLSSLSFCMADLVSARTADYHITRQWMRTILWQHALSMGLLSSAAYETVLTFGFPVQVGRDLLQALRWFCETDLLPLGRDQLLKCFEVANSLADTVLLSPAGSCSRLELGPQDFLHGLYQKIVPFLDQDHTLKSILRSKTAEALITAPARLLSVGEISFNLGLHECESVPIDVLESTSEDPRKHDESLADFNWLVESGQQIY